MLAVHALRRFVLLLALVALVSVACSSGSSNKPGSAGNIGGSRASAPGVSSTQVRIGLVTSLTGVESAQFDGAVQGAQARIDLQNAEGGVDGRHLVLVTADDGSSPTQAVSAVSELVTAKNVFGLMFVSGVTATANRLPQQESIPVVGAPVDGPEWGIRPNTNMFAVSGNQGPTGLAASTVEPQLMRIAGANNVATLGYGDEPESSQSAKDFVAGAKSFGLRVGYKNYSIPLGSVDMTSVALAMKSAGVNGFYAALIDTTTFALMSALRDAGVAMKAPLLTTGYGQEILDQPEALKAAQGAIFSVMQTPVEESTSATRIEQQAFEKYEHFSGVPNLNWTYGWLSADLFIRGLEAAGNNPTRSSFISGLHGVRNWDGGGLLPTPVDLSLSGFGHFPATSCSYFVQLKGSAFVPLNGGKAVCGKIVT